MFSLPILSDRFYRRWNMITDLIIINLLTLISLLPVVTAGAGLTACSWCAGRVLRGEDCGARRDWWLSFRTNLKQSLLWWLPALVMLYITISQLREGFESSDAAPLGASEAISLVIVALGAVLAIWLVPLIAFFHNSLAAHTLHAAVLASSHIVRSIAGLTCVFLPWALVAIIPATLTVVVLLYACIGLSGTAYGVAWVQREVIDALRDRSLACGDDATNIS